MFGVMMDITDRKAIEAEILATQARLEVQRRLIEQREQERQRIARDLHDGPVQALLAATFALHGLRDGDCADEVRQALEHIQASVQEQVSELRAYAGELRPPILAKFGLAKAIRSHLDSFGPKHPSLQLHFEESSTGPLLPEPFRVTLYRIYQESLANIVRHARASEVAIRLTVTKEHAHLEIQDNGVGVELPGDWLDLARHGHLGLVGMRERAEAVGGTVHIHSQPNQGTCIQVDVPIVHEVVSPIIGLHT
jgi:signal transduction histidine kinase